MQQGATLVFLDANILVSRTLRDWFCIISQESGVDGIEPRWSEDVMTEYQYHVRKANPGWSEQQIGGWRRRLSEAFPAALITGYEITNTHLAAVRDPLDAHVIAAAEHGKVDYLVTANYSDFEPAVDGVEFEIYLPDQMLCLIAQRRPEAISKAARRQIEYWAKKSSNKTLHQALVDAGAPEFALLIKQRMTYWATTGKY